MPTAFIIGGTGQIGVAAAAEFIAHGWAVTLAHSGRRKRLSTPPIPGARHVIVDRHDTKALGEALGDGADLLIDTMAFGGADAAQLLSLQDRIGHLAVISSASVYADPAGRTLETAGETGFPEFDGPITEAAGTVAPGPEGYSRSKVELERRLLDGITRPLTILRPCAIHGIGSQHPREYWFVKRMLDRRETIPLAFRGESRFHTTATVNLAALLRAAAEAPPATRILNSADPEAPSVGEIGEIVAARLGYTGRFVPLDGAGAGIGHTPWSTPRPFIFSMEAAAAIGYRPAGSYAWTVGPCIDWLAQQSPDDWRSAFPVLASYPGDIFDYASEDKALGG